MTAYIQILLNGSVNGLLLACLALGFAIVYLPTKTFYIALGAIYALTPYIAKAVLEGGGSWSLALLVAICIAVLISLINELINHRPLEKKQSSEGAHLIASLGLYIVLVEAIAIIWGNNPQVLRHGLDTIYRWNDFFLTQGQVLAGIISLAILAIFFVWLHNSNLGLRLRAMADNPTEFALRGFNIHTHRLLIFCLSAVLASIAAILSAYDVGFDPHRGLHMLILAIVAVIIGGQTSFWGAIVGGLMIGVLRSLVVWHFSAQWQDVATFILLALFLCVRPRGILGRKTRMEMET